MTQKLYNKPKLVWDTELEECRWGVYVFSYHKEFTVVYIFGKEYEYINHD